MIIKKKKKKYISIEFSELLLVVYISMLFLISTIYLL